MSEAGEPTVRTAHSQHPASRPNEPTNTVSEARFGGAVSVSGEATPVLRVVRGDPTPEQLAALVAVLSARARAARAAAEGTAERTVARSAWRDPARLLRGETARGPNAWRHSAWPR